MPMRATSHWKFTSRKFPYLKNPSMLRFMQTLPTNQTRRERRPLAVAIRLPSQKSIAVVEKSSAANGGVPCAIKNVTCDREEIFPRVPGTHAPVHAYNNC